MQAMVRVRTLKKLEVVDLIAQVADVVVRDGVLRQNLADFLGATRSPRAATASQA